MEQLYSLFGRYGLAAILLLIFLEYGCFPVSSEIILPCSGFLAALQGIPFPVLVIASTIAGLAGTSITYVIGRAGGSPLLERLMKRFPSFEKPILASYRKFGDRGAIAVFAASVPDIYWVCCRRHEISIYRLSHIFRFWDLHLEQPAALPWLLFLSVSRTVLFLF